MSDEETGLLKKASEIVETNAGHETDDPDHKDVLAHIEKIASQNRINVTPQLFSFKPLKNGTRMPILVNSIAVFFIGAAIAFSLLTQTNKDLAIQANDIQLQSAEGKLLAEERKKNQTDLESKDKQLQEINVQLSKIAEERANLAQTLEEKVKQREIILKAQLAAAIEAEKTRLRAQGFSEEEIQKRLKEFEAKKIIEFNQALAQYRKQAEAEKKQAEQQLTDLEAQYNNQLKAAAKERESLLSEGKKREAELEEKLRAAQNAAAAAANANISTNTTTDDAAKKAILAAQDQINKLNQAREQEKNLDNQLAGLYAILQNQISAKKWSDASATLDKLGGIIRSDIFISTDSLRQKREKESFVIEGLRQYIEREKTMPATNEFIKNASIITNAQSLLSEAQGFVKAGNSLSAQVTYDALLKSLPGAQEAANFKIDQAKLLNDANLEKLTKDFQVQIADLKKSYESLNGAVDSETVKTLNDDLASLKADYEKNQTELAKVQQELKDEKKKSNLELAQLKAEGKKLQEQIRSQTAKIDELGAENEKLKSGTISSQNNEIAETVKALQQQLAKLTDENKALDAKLKSLNTASATPSPSQNPNATPSAKPIDPAVLAEREAQIKALQDTIAKNKLAMSDYDALIKSYQSYQTKIKNLKPESSVDDLNSASTAFRAFVNSAEVNKVLPNLVKAANNEQDLGKKVVLNDPAKEFADFLIDIQNNPRYRTLADKQKKVQDKINASSGQTRELYQAIYNLLK